jgi:RNA recognition motif-containing protein
MNALDELRQCQDVATLKPALQKLCEKFGQITRLDILTAMHEGTKQAICFVRLDSPENELALMKTLGVGRFGGEIVFVVDLNVPVASRDAGPSSQWAEFHDFE